MPLRTLCWSVVLAVTWVPTASVAQVAYCRSDLKIVQQAPEWCRQHGRPWVTVAVPGRPTDIESLKLIQLQLTALGFYPGPIDGRLGPATLYAIRKFQGSVGSDPDGAITSDLQSQLAQRTLPAGTEVVEVRANAVFQPPSEQSQGTAPSRVPEIIHHVSNQDRPKLVVLTTVVLGLLAVALGGLAGVACLVVKVMGAFRNEPPAIHRGTYSPLHQSASAWEPGRT
jgi:hypothetical protein